MKKSSYYMLYSFWQYLFVIVLLEENIVSSKGLSKQSNYAGLVQEHKKENTKLNSDLTRLSRSQNTNHDKRNHKSEITANKYEEKLQENAGKSFNLWDGYQRKINRRNYVNLEKDCCSSSNSNGKPLSESRNLHYKTYILGPDEINENVIREIIGPRKLQGLPRCTKLQYDETEKFRGIEKFLKLKQVALSKNPELNKYVNKRHDKNADYIKEKRSRWKLNRMKTNSESRYVFKKKSPLDYLHIKNDGSNKYYTDLVKVIQRKDDPQINNSFKNYSSQGQHYLGYTSHHERKTKNTFVDNFPLKISQQDSKLDKSSEKMTKSGINEEIDNLQSDNNNNILQEGEIKYSVLDSKNTVSQMGINNNDDEIDLSKTRPNTSTEDDAPVNYSMEQKADIANPSKKVLDDKQQLITGLLLKIDNKILYPGIQTIEQQLDSETAEVVHKGVKMNLKQENSDGNQSYIYLQPVPLASPYLIQKPINQNESFLNLQQKASDDIIISINPKTLENKILHAEFFKKSEEKKTPDTLSIELAPIGNLQGAANSTHTEESKAKTSLAPTSMSPQNLVTEKIEVREKKEKSRITNTKNLPNEIYNFENPSYKNTLTLENNNIKKYSGDSKGISNIEQTKFDDPRKNVQKRKCQRCDHMFGNINDNFRKANLPAISHKTDVKDNGSKQHLLHNNGLDEVIVVQTKQKELCPSQVGCEPTPKIVLCADSNCYKTTQNMDNFRELNEGRLRQDDAEEFNEIYKENPNWVKECSSLPGNPPFKCFNSSNTQKCPSQCLPNEFKREILQPELTHTDKKTEQLENNKSIKIERRKRASPEGNELIQLKDESEINLEKGNKKVENKILEGFINSIIANYSREGGKATTQEPIDTNDRSDDGDAVIRVIKEFTNKRKIEDSDNLNLMPVIVPEAKAIQIKDNEMISKFGPFNDDQLKSLLEKMHIS